MTGLLLGGVAVLGVGCGTVLRPLNAEKAAARLSSRDVVSVREACSASLVYEDQPRGIAVYVLDFKGHRAVCDPKGTYELVLILDPSNGVERYRLLRVK